MTYSKKGGEPCQLSMFFAVLLLLEADDLAMGDKLKEWRLWCNMSSWMRATCVLLVTRVVGSDQTIKMDRNSPGDSPDVRTSGSSCNGLRYEVDLPDVSCENRAKHMGTSNLATFPSASMVLADEFPGRFLGRTSIICSVQGTNAHVKVVCRAPSEGGSSQALQAIESKWPKAYHWWRVLEATRNGWVASEGGARCGCATSWCCWDSKHSCGPCVGSNQNQP